MSEVACRRAPLTKWAHTCAGGHRARRGRSRTWTLISTIRRPGRTFINGLMAGNRNELGARLPDFHVAGVDERFEVDTSEPVRPSSFRPDVLVGRFEEEADRPDVSPERTS